MLATVANESSETSGREAISGLTEPSPRIFWCDLAASSLIGWTGFACAVFAPFWSALFAAAVLAAFVGLYRGLGFLHEISHIRRGGVRGFETVWNLLIGSPLLMPSFMYVGVHSDHHSPQTYGTNKDPEYMPFAGDPVGIVLFVAHTVLLPLLLLARFLVMAPIGLLVPAFQRWLGAHASSLTMNFRYLRHCQDIDLARMRLWQGFILLLWVAVAFVALHAGVAGRVLGVWYAVMAAVSMVNALRALGAHRYESRGEKSDRDAQIADSIDTPGGWLTEIWAPVGLRYHALHHYFPTVPYHNLGMAYRRLMSALPKDSFYRRCTSPSLAHSLLELAGKRRRRG